MEILLRADKDVTPRKLWFSKKGVNRQDNEGTKAEVYKQTSIFIITKINVQCTVCTVRKSVSGPGDWFGQEN